MSRSLRVRPLARIGIVLTALAFLMTILSYAGVSKVTYGRFRVGMFVGFVYAVWYPPGVNDGVGLEWSFQRARGGDHVRTWLRWGLWPSSWPSFPATVNRSVPMWMILAGAAIPTYLLWRRDRRFPSGRCSRCGYDLTANTTGVCPECGTEARRALT